MSKFIATIAVLVLMLTCGVAMAGDQQAQGKAMNTASKTPATPITCDFTMAGAPSLLFGLRAKVTVPVKFADRNKAYDEFLEGVKDPDKFIEDHGSKEQWGKEVEAMRHTLIAFIPSLPVGAMDCKMTLDCRAAEDGIEQIVSITTSTIEIPIK